MRCEHGNSLRARRDRAIATKSYFEQIEFARQALRNRKEELKVHRLILKWEAGDVTELCKLVDAVCKLRQLMLEYCRVPKRPIAESGRRVQIPEITLESVPEPPQDS